ncbi:MAG: DUF368 domain-containing protein [Candidatus Woesearchaeota archaeon]
MVSLTIFLKGILMGFADVLPGISGATVAILVGIYDQLIKSFDHVFFHLFSKKLFSKELLFLINLYAGVGLGIIILSRLLGWLFNIYKSEVYAFIIGLIVSSGIILLNKNRKLFRNFTSFYFFSLGLFLAVLFSMLSFSISQHNEVILLISGFLAMCAMILPGISGSYLLLMLNQYEYVISLVNSFSPKLIYFAIGLFLGVGLMARLLKILLNKFRIQTLCFLIGLIFGGLYFPFKMVQLNFIAMILFLIGLSIGYTLEVLR